MGEADRHRVPTERRSTLCCIPSRAWTASPTLLLSGRMIIFGFAKAALPRSVASIVTTAVSPNSTLPPQTVDRLGLFRGPTEIFGFAKARHIRSRALRQLATSRNFRSPLVLGRTALRAGPTETFGFPRVR